MIEFNTRPERPPARILDFDIENRPLNYWYDDKTTAEITAIAWAWYGDTDHKGRPYVHVRLLKRPPKHVKSAIKMLTDFRLAFVEADLVTGHFIRGHDLLLVQSALIENGLPPLRSKLTSDTKLDLLKRKDLSVSQKNLAGMLGVHAPKIDMPSVDWREANRLTDDGLLLTEARVVGDVLQHMEMRRALLDAGLLAAPKTWVPGIHANDDVYIP